MRKVSLSIAAASALVVGVALQVTVAVAVPPTGPGSSPAGGDSWVFITSNQETGNNTTDYVWLPDGTHAIDPNYLSVPQTPATPITNAVGYRVADGYIYGLYNNTSNGTANLVQIYYDGTQYVANNLGLIPGLQAPSGTEATGFNAGTFGAGPTADIMYLLVGGGSTLYQLNFGDLQPANGGTCASPAVPSATCLPKLTTVDLSMTLQDTADLFWSQDYLWGVYTDNCSGQGNPCGVGIYRIAASPAGVTTAGPVAVSSFDFNQGWAGIPSTDWSPHGYQSQWVYPDGSFGISASDGSPNARAYVYRCTIANPTSATDVGISCSSSDRGPIHNNNINDGTSSGLGARLSLVKGPQDPVVLAGETATYTITIRNEGPGWTGWVMTDPLQSGLSDPKIVNYSRGIAVCDIVNGAIQCHSVGGPLPAGGSVVISYTAHVDSYATPDCKIKNTATIWPYASGQPVSSSATVSDPNCGTTPTTPTTSTTGPTSSTSSSSSVVPSTSAVAPTVMTDGTPSPFGGLIAAATALALLGALSAAGLMWMRRPQAQHVA